MQVAISFNGMVGGITLGLFTLGMFFPWANSRGALVGSLVAVVLITVMCIGQQIAIASEVLVETPKNTSIDHCYCINNTQHDSLIITKENSSSEVFYLFRISYIWFSALGMLTTVIVGLIVSFITTPENPGNIDWDLLSPPIRKYLLSLGARTKQRLNIPLKMSSNKKVPNYALEGVLNIALDNNEEYKENEKISLNSDTKEKVRKNFFSFSIKLAQTNVQKHIY